MMIKRLFDIVVSVTALVILSPILLTIALLLRLSMGPGIFFRQERPGLGERPFTIVKFRTMTAAPQDSGDLAPDSQRITRLGGFLRATSLDELPELWNVLRGDMSLVGPRPLLMQYLPRYSTTERRRHEVRPGLTGLAQVSGRNALSWEEKFALDIHYVDHRSFVGDLRILWRTARAVLKRDGISAPGEATMSEFLGSASKDPESAARPS